MAHSSLAPPARCRLSQVIAHETHYVPSLQWFSCSATPTARVLLVESVLQEQWTLPWQEIPGSLTVYPSCSRESASCLGARKEQLVMARCQLMPLQHLSQAH